jgi:hypothetical protein
MTHLTPEMERVAHEAWKRQNDRVRGLAEGQFGPYTEADWTDVMRIWVAFLAARAVPTPFTEEGV